MTDSEHAAIVAQLRTEQRAKWLALVAKYQARELYSKDVAELLREGLPPIPEALPMLADILTGEGLPLKSTKRQKSVYVNGQHWAAREYAMGFIDAHIDAGENIQAAKELACTKLGVSMRSIEAWRKEKVAPDTQ